MIVEMLVEHYYYYLLILLRKTKHFLDITTTYLLGLFRFRFTVIVELLTAIFSFPRGASCSSSSSCSDSSSSLWTERPASSNKLLMSLPRDWPGGRPTLVGALGTREELIPGNIEDKNYSNVLLFTTAALMLVLTTHWGSVMAADMPLKCSILLYYLPLYIL